MLGPLLFPHYIKDLPSAVSGYVNLCADDVLLYHVISSAEDYTVLQEMVNSIE